jgi:3-deoxy-D-manno-octulosonic acid kinase
MLVARPSLFEPLARCLRASGTLYDWAEAQPQSRALQGRAVVYVAEVPGTGVRVAVRHAWHGGLLAPLTGDRFVVPTRAPREAAASITLPARGIDTPEVIAYALYPAGPGLRRVDVCTAYVPDAWDFGAVLAGHAPALPRADAERAVLGLLSRLASAGVVHPDLNVKNILLRPATTGVPHTWLLDVDVVEFRDGPAPHVMHRNLGRLVRSIRKWHRRLDLPLDEAWLAGFATSALAATP